MEEALLAKGNTISVLHFLWIFKHFNENLLNFPENLEGEYEGIRVVPPRQFAKIIAERGRGPAQ